MTFQLLVAGMGWKPTADSLTTARVFEYTDEALKAACNVNTVEGRSRLQRIPALMMAEGRDDFARVATLFDIRVAGSDVHFKYVYDPDIQPIPQDFLDSNKVELGIDEWEFTRTHWAVKDTDLFRFLLRKSLKPRHVPKVFKLADRDDADLVAVMMPFDGVYRDVFETIKAAAQSVGYNCQRADDIWEDSVIIQDVVSLISRAAVVVCDCTNRNANVFYESGIAHAVGREVVLIAQSKSDIPFDLQHHRYIQYLNNGEGRQALQATLTTRLATLRGT